MWSTEFSKEKGNWELQSGYMYEYKEKTDSKSTLNQKTKKKVSDPRQNV